MRNNSPSRRHPRSTTKLLFILLVVLISVTGYFIFSDANANPTFAGYLSAKPSGKEGADTVLLIQGKPEKDMSIRGYTARLIFDPDNLTVTSIQYKLGVVSDGLGSSNRTLDAVNKGGTIKLMGEAHEQNGAFLKGKELQTIAEITVRKKSRAGSAVTLSSQDGAFYMITDDGRLVKVPMGNSASLQVK